MRIVYWMMTAVLAHQLAASARTMPAAQPAAAPRATLDYEYFKTQVQPVFLAKRTGYTRCVVCHADENAAGFLQPLSPGAATWNEEQSRKNFQSVSRLVVPGQPMKSRLLTHPLEPAAGGDECHNGGRQFKTQDDPQFQAIAAWVSGKTAGSQR
jgi:mono/diheme cytochrome c family protein